MFNTLSLACFPRRIHPAQVAPVALAGVALIAAVLASAPRGAIIPSVSPELPVASLMLTNGGSPALLQAASESLRAELRAVPGVGAVEMRGLQTAGVELRYAPGHLPLGVRDADLMAAVPADAMRPGVVAVRPDAAQDGRAAIADRPVHAGRRVVRLGDVTLVARTLLPTPVARLFRDGRPTVELVVTPAQGQAGPALDRRVARTLAAVALPADVEMR